MFGHEAGVSGKGRRRIRPQDQTTFDIFAQSPEPEQPATKYNNNANAHYYGTYCKVSSNHHHQSNMHHGPYVSMPNHCSCYPGNLTSNSFEYDPSIVPNQEYVIYEPVDPHINYQHTHHNDHHHHRHMHYSHEPPAAPTYAPYRQSGGDQIYAAHPTHHQHCHSHHSSSPKYGHFYNDMKPAAGAKHSIHVSSCFQRSSNANPPKRTRESSTPVFKEITQAALSTVRRIHTSSNNLYQKSCTMVLSQSHSVGVVKPREHLTTEEDFLQNSLLCKCRLSETPFEQAVGEPEVTKSKWTGKKPSKVVLQDEKAVNTDIDSVAFNKLLKTEALRAVIEERGVQLKAYIAQLEDKVKKLSVPLPANEASEQPIRPVELEEKSNSEEENEVNCSLDEDKKVEPTILSLEEIKDDETGADWMNLEKFIETTVKKNYDPCIPVIIEDDSDEEDQKQAKESEEYEVFSGYSPGSGKNYQQSDYDDEDDDYEDDEVPGTTRIRIEMESDVEETDTKSGKTSQKTTKKISFLKVKPTPPFMKAYPDPNMQLVQCPHCSRKFTKAAAERHIWICQNIKTFRHKLNPDYVAPPRPAY